MKLGDYLVAYLKRSVFLTYSGYRVIWSLISFLNSGAAKGSKSSRFPMGQASVSLPMAMRGAPARLARMSDVRRGRSQHSEPVAGSFSERVPILVISGGPGEQERQLGVLIHYQAKEIELQFRIFREPMLAL